MTGNQTDFAQDSIHMFRFLKRSDSTRDLTALEDWQCQRADRLKGIKEVTHYVESIRSETSFANVQWDGVEELWFTQAQIVDLSDGRFERFAAELKACRLVAKRAPVYQRLHGPGQGH